LRKSNVTPFEWVQSPMVYKEAEDFRVRLLELVRTFFQPQYSLIMTIQDLKDQGLIIYECISGSRAYGLETATSDTDIRGVFILPKDMIFGLEYVPQVANETNDIVYYELGRFFELLKKNNPNILELLNTPKDKILIKHPVMDKIDPTIFISKKCKDTFGGYAFTQVKKARGLNKKIVNPVDKERKSMLNFCYVLHGQGALPLSKWLELNNYQQEQCGLVNVAHFKAVYGIYYDENNEFGYKGIQKKDSATTVLLSSIPKGAKSVGHLYFNEDGFVKYCKDYREYWEWVEQRNEHRYQDNLEHGKNYDSKNMMHTFRLLDMAIEILSTGKINVRRPNRDELLSIRKGDWEYDELIEKADAKMKELEKAFSSSHLPKEPNYDAIESLLVACRKEIYKES